MLKVGDIEHEVEANVDILEAETSRFPFREDGKRNSRSSIQK